MADASPSSRLGTSLDVFQDARGTLTLADFDSLPFLPQRAYVLHAIPSGARRGGHAHRVQHRYLGIVSGRAAVVEDDGTEVRTFEVGAGDSLHVPPGVWHELEALEDGLVVLVLASGRHEPDGYVHERVEVAALASRTASQTLSA
jgi:mannose-6-phosphate isomerase-like protein (cupin superfamily)